MEEHKLIEERENEFAFSCPNLPNEAVIVGYCHKNDGYWMCTVCGKILGKDREALRLLK